MYLYIYIRLSDCLTVSLEIMCSPAGQRLNLDLPILFQQFFPVVCCVCFSSRNQLCCTMSSVLLLRQAAALAQGSKRRTVRRCTAVHAVIALVELSLVYIAVYKCFAYAFRLGKPNSCKA